MVWEGSKKFDLSEAFNYLLSNLPVSSIVLKGSSQDFQLESVLIY